MAGKSYEKLIDQIGEMSVIELAEMVKALETKFGVSATPVATVSNASAAPVAEAAAEKSEYKVTLKESGADKIKVIKALRTVTTLGLGEAKAAVEGAPFVIAEAASKDDAKKMKEALEAAGAKVELA
ncbi:MAG: 50S ribosomal protein L7/L12 [Proteobacteria bacterium]|jgi:large subunit ribosomal protein L7/L12|nr:50S ribosomal protein L7/L12 [Pseudomonadota bacterium]NBP15027.1 50S ribosomal protein L7/L12 [bacterium]